MPKHEQNLLGCGGACGLEKNALRGHMSGSEAKISVEILANVPVDMVNDCWSE
jgi:hypothetical protein